MGDDRGPREFGQCRALRAVSAGRASPAGSGPGGPVAVHALWFATATVALADYRNQPVWTITGHRLSVARGARTRGHDASPEQRPRITALAKCGIALTAACRPRAGGRG